MDDKLATYRKVLVEAVTAGPLALDKFRRDHNGAPASDPLVVEITYHKVREAMPEMTAEDRQASRRWLLARGFSTFDPQP